MTWLDEARWNSMEVMNNPIFNSLQNEEKILVHWLCYITDRQRPFRQVWGKGGVIFSQIVKDYSSHSFKLFSKNSVNNFLDQYRKMNSKKTIKPYIYEDIEYASRYGADDKSINRTLTLLFHYEKNIVNFIEDQINIWLNEKEPLVNVAYSLDLLTYRNNISIDKANNILHSEELFKKGLSYWKKTRTSGHKRLWAALRDYRKPKSPFFKKLMDSLSPNIAKIWYSKIFDIDQIELPGDVWNERLNDNLLIHIAKNAGIAVKRRTNYKESPLIARLMYEKIKGVNPDYYPERLDVSFDFAPRMCNQCDEGRYKICPFGMGSLDLCYEDEGYSSGKYCPVQFSTCGYLNECDPTNCPIKKGIGKGLCNNMSRIR